MSLKKSTKYIIVLLLHLNESDLCTSQRESPGGAAGIPGDSDNNQDDHTGASDSELEVLTVNPLGTKGILTRHFSDVRNPLVCQQSPPWGFTLTGA